MVTERAGHLASLTGSAIGTAEATQVHFRAMEEMQKHGTSR